MTKQASQDALRAELDRWRRARERADPAALDLAADLAIRLRRAPELCGPVQELEVLFAWMADLQEVDRHADALRVGARAVELASNHELREWRSRLDARRAHSACALLDFEGAAAILANALEVPVSQLSEAPQTA